MKLLTVHDEIRNVIVTDSRFDENSIHFLDEKTDAMVRKIASQYLAGRSDAHLKRIPNDNAYLLWKDTDIKYGNNRQAQGVVIQFDLLDSEICDVNFFTANMEHMKRTATVLSYDLHRTHYIEGNVDALKKGTQGTVYYDAEMVHMFKELGERFKIQEKDSDVFFKNRYLMLEKGKLETNILFDLYRDIKDMTGDEECHYSKPGRCVLFKLNGEDKRINILGGHMPEMGGYIYFTKEKMLAHIKNLINGKEDIPPVIYNGVEFELSRYSKSKNLEDMIDPRFRDNYLSSLIQYNADREAMRQDNQQDAER